MMILYRDKLYTSEYNLYIQENPKISEGVIGFTGVYPTQIVIDCIGY